MRGLTRGRVLAAARASAICPTPAAVADSRRSRWTSCCRAAPTPSWTCSPAHLEPRSAPRAGRGDGAGASRRRIQPRGARRTACARCTGAATASAMIAIDHPVVREAIREVIAAGTPGADPGLRHRRTRRASAMSASTTAPPAASPAICSAGSCRARRARWRCSRARSAIAATRSARWASATSSPRSSRTCASSSCARCATISSAATPRPARCSPPDPGLRGIYNIGAGNRGIARALEESRPGARGGVHRP